MNISSDPTHALDYDSRHYGYEVGEDPDDPADARNVNWNIGGNPFKIIPYGFGGRLDIEATETMSSSYDEPQESLSYRRNDSDQTGQISIQKCKVMDTYISNGKRYPKLDGEGKVIYRDVIVNTTAVLSIPAGTPTGNITIDTSKGNPKPSGGLLGHTDQLVYFKDISASGHPTISVGIDQELHSDSADEYGTITPQSHSFKYYMNPYIFVYDTVKVDASTTQNVELTKTDKDHKFLKGAQYALYKDNVKVQSDLTTNANGKLIIEKLSKGSYKLIETKAPDGYVLDATPMNFEVEETDGIAIDGGTKSFETNNGDASATPKTYTAFTNEVYIAGFLDTNNVDNKDRSIKLSLKSGSDNLARVIVTYADLDGTKDKKEIYNTLQEAEDAVNQFNKDNKIAGDVAIKAEFEKTGTKAIQLSHTNDKTPIEPDPGKPDTPEEPNKKPNTNTGDATSIGLWATAGTISFLSLIVVLKKLH